jgi:hypothetical protein
MNKLLLSFWLILVILLLLSLWTEAAVWRIFGEDSWKVLGGEYWTIWGIPVRLIYVASFVFLIFLIQKMRKKEQSPHPLTFTVFWFALLFVISLWFWNVRATWTVGEDTFKVNWAVYIIPFLLVANLLMLLVDIFRRGKLLKGIGEFLSWGYPQFSKSLELLVDWYDNEKAQVLAKNFEARAKIPHKVLLEKHPFARWMISEITWNYENNVQAMAYWGAAILIVLIGFRGVKIIPKDEPTLVLVGLWLELSLLFLLGIVLFFKPEELGASAPPIHGELSEKQLKTLKEELKQDIEIELKQKEKLLEGLSGEVLKEYRQKLAAILLK